MAELLEDVTRTSVAEKLHQRRPQILISDVPEQLARFEARKRGASLEVRVLVGTNPPAGTFRDIAAEAIALETASLTEYAEYPEQQIQGADGRGYFLHQQYLEKLALLARLVADAGGTVPADGEPVPTSTSPGLPSGRFPDPLPYPDPAVVAGATYRSKSALAEWEIP